jgi:hypothetical protein
MIAGLFLADVRGSFRLFARVLRRAAVGSNARSARDQGAAMSFSASAIS